MSYPKLYLFLLFFGATALVMPAHAHDDAIPGTITCSNERVTYHYNTIRSQTRRRHILQYGWYATALCALGASLYYRTSVPRLRPLMHAPIPHAPIPHAPSPHQANGPLHTATRYLAKLFVGTARWVVQDVILASLAYQAISTIIDPIQRLLREESTVAVNQCWFLQEQIHNPNTQFCLVGHCLHELTVILITLDQLSEQWISALSYTDPSLNRYTERMTWYAQTYAETVARLEGLLQYIIQHERRLNEVGYAFLFDETVDQINAAISIWNSQLKAYQSGATTDLAVHMHILRQQIREAVRPWQGLSVLTIKPWPIWNIALDTLRAHTTTTMVLR